MGKIAVFIYDRLVDYDIIKHVISPNHIYCSAVGFTKGVLITCGKSNVLGIHPSQLPYSKNRTMFGLYMEINDKFLPKLDGYYGCSEEWYGKASPIDPVFRTKETIQLIKFDNIYQLENKMYDLSGIRDAMCYYANIDHPVIKQRIAVQHGHGKHSKGEAYAGLKKIQKWEGKMKKCGKM